MTCFLKDAQNNLGCYLKYKRLEDFIIYKNKILEPLILVPSNEIIAKPSLYTRLIQLKVGPSESNNSAAPTCHTDVKTIKEIFQFLYSETSFNNDFPGELGSNCCKVEPLNTMNENEKLFICLLRNGPKNSGVDEIIYIITTHGRLFNIFSCSNGLAVSGHIKFPLRVVGHIGNIINSQSELTLVDKLRIYEEIIKIEKDVRYDYLYKILVKVLLEEPEETVLSKDNHKNLFNYFKQYKELILQEYPELKELIQVESFNNELSEINTVKEQLSLDKQKLFEERKQFEKEKKNLLKNINNSNKLKKI